MRVAVRAPRTNGGSLSAFQQSQAHELSLRRAHIVASMLIEAGARAEGISSVGVGASASAPGVDLEVGCDKVEVLREAFEEGTRRARDGRAGRGARPHLGAPSSETPTKPALRLLSLIHI